MWLREFFYLPSFLDMLIQFLNKSFLNKQLLIVTQSEAKSLEYTHEDVHEILRRFAPLDDKLHLITNHLILYNL